MGGYIKLSCLRDVDEKKQGNANLNIMYGVVTERNPDRTYKVHLDDTPENEALPKVLQIVDGGDFGKRKRESLQIDGERFSRGSRFKYEKGERVVIAFAYGKEEFALILGALPSFDKIKLEFDDFRYNIKDKDGNTVNIDKTGNINIKKSSGETIVLEDGKIEIDSGKKITMSDTKITLHSGATPATIKPIGRVGDSVQVTIPPGSFLVAATAGVLNPAPVNVTGTITSGSPVSESG